MKKWLSRIISFITGLALLLVFAFTAMQFVIFDMNRYEKSYKEASTAETIGIAPEDLTYVTQTVLDYLELKNDSMDITAEIRGENRHVFRDRELIHMVDVRGLFRNGFLMRRIAVIISVLGVAALVIIDRKAFLYSLAGGYLAAMVLFLLFALVAGIAVAVDFYDTFILFHKIFFTNDFWLLNADDMLIMMFPEEFFNNITVGLLVWVSCAVVFIPGAASVSAKIVQRKKTKNT